MTLKTKNMIGNRTIGQIIRDSEADYAKQSLKVLEGTTPFKRDLGHGYHYEYLPHLKTVWFGKIGKMSIEKVEGVITVNDLTKCVERWENWIKDLKTPLQARRGVSNSEPLFI